MSNRTPPSPPTPAGQAREDPAVLDPASRDPQPDSLAAPELFRPPSRRERGIAAGLFLGFAAFFVALAIVWAGSGFRWVLMGLGVWSGLYAWRQFRGRA